MKKNYLVPTFVSLLLIVVAAFSHLLLLAMAGISILLFLAGYHIAEYITNHHPLMPYAESSTFISAKMNVELKKMYRKLPLIFFAFILSGAAHAQTRYAVANGNWNATSTWSATEFGAAGASVPTSANAVVISRSFNVTLNISNAACGSLQLGSTTSGNGNGTLTFASASQLTVSAAVVMGNSGSTSRNGSIDMTNGGTLICASISSLSTNDNWTPGTGTLQLTGTFNLPVANITGSLNTFNNLIIASGTSTLLGATSVTGNLTVNSILAGNATLTLSTAAKTIDGSSTISNTGTMAVTAARTFLPTANLTIAGPITLSNNVTVTNNGVVTSTNTGTAINGSNANSLWVNNDTLNYAGSSIMTTGGLTANASPNLVNYNGNGQTVKAVTYYNLTLSGTNTKTITGVSTINGDFTFAGSASATASTAITIGGNLTLGSGTTFNAGTSQTHNLAGNWINNGGTFTYTTGNTINFNGTGSQTIGGTTATTFNNLTNSNTAGNGLSLLLTTTINNNLSFSSASNGIIATGSNSLVLTKTTPLTAITGASSTRFVYGTLQFAFPAGNTGALLFPIGYSTTYSPVTLTITGAASSLNIAASTVTGAPTNENNPITNSSGIDQTRKSGNYWTITKVSGTVTSYTGLFDFSNATHTGTVANYKLRNFTSAWADIATPTIGVNTISKAGLTVFGEFEAGEANSIAAAGVPNNKTTCAGVDVSFSASTASSPVPNVKWQRSVDGIAPYVDITAGLDAGTTYSGFNTYTLTLTAPTVALNNYHYQAVMTNINGTDIAIPGTLTVLVAPAITTQPVSSQTVCSGTSVNLNVVATGGGLTYQWYKGSTALVNGGNVSGATTATLTLNPISTTDAATNYNCVVSGTCTPSKTTNNATINVNQQVNIITQPTASQTVCLSGAVSFSVAATGTGLTYQWYKGITPLADGGTISGSNTNTLTISSIVAGDAGTNYNCVVSGSSPCGAVTSNNAALVIGQAASISTQPVSSQSVCTGSTVNFSVGASGFGLTYQWYKSGTLLTNTGNYSGATSATLTISSVSLADADNHYYCVVSGNCAPAATSNDAALFINTAPTTANAGPDQTGAATCGTTAVTLAANTPVYGTGAWSIVTGTGGSFSDVTDPAATFTGTAGVTYTLRWTITNSPCLVASSDDVVIGFNLFPTTAVAGPNQTDAATCGLTTVTLAANTPVVGTGTWSVFSGAGGSFGNVNSPTSTFTGTAGITYILKWTISNSPCTASSDFVTITFNQNPTTANAGPDQTGITTCGLTTVTLAGNNPTVGTGTWSVVTGTGGSFGNANSSTSSFTGIAGNSYTLRWTISNSPCNNSSDDVNITFNLPPTVANAGPDQNGAATCGLTTVTLAANTPVIGTGAWSVVSGTGGSFGNASSPTSTFTGTAGTTYTLRWTISNSPCTNSTDDVIITFNKNPTVANAGPDQMGAATCGLTSATLAGNVPTVGTGTWSVVSGVGGSFVNANNATTTFNGVSGTTYTLRWTIANSPCTASFDDVIIKFNKSTTVANAGPDQTGTSTCGLTTVTLAGNTPTAGTGSWSIVSGTGGSFGNASNPTSSFSGVAGNTYTLRWTITNSPCTTTTDDVVITFNVAPVVTIATNYCYGNGYVQLTASGASSYLWSTGATTSQILVNLAGSYSVTGTNAVGCTYVATTTVSQELVTNGNFNSGNTGFTTSYTLTSGFYTGVPTSGLYPEGLYAVNTNANNYHPAFYGTDHTTGSGNFMIINGSGSSTPTTVWQETVTVNPNTTYYFSAWGLSMNNVAPFAALQFAVDGVQVGTVAALTGNTRTTAPFTWQQFYGTWNSGPSASSAVISIVDTSRALGGNDFGLDDISFGTLSPVTFAIAPAGNGGSLVCSGSTLNLAANQTGGASPFTYSWTGPHSFSSSLANPTIASASLLDSGTYNLTVTDGFGCSVNSSVFVGVYPPIGNNTISANQTICSGTAPAAFTGSTPTGGNGTYTYLWESSTTSGSSGFATATGTSNGKNYTSGTLTQTTWFRRTVSSGGCSDISSTILITVNPPTPATPGTISGTTPVCPASGSLVYSIAAVTNATTYTWAVPAGWTINSGQGTTSITVTSGAFGQNGNISVTAGNSCGTSGAKTLAVTVVTTPAVPGTITGTVNQCPSQINQTYSISAVASATTYTWTVPAGWTITGGQGTTSIQVTTGTTGQNGNITVTAGNSCGTSTAQTLSVTVVAIPATPGTITGTVGQCPALTAQTYSIAAVTYATTYTWSVPVGWTISSGQGTTSIQVTTGASGQNGNISVTAGNSCGTSSAKTLAVTVNPGAPAAPGTITGSGSVCPGINTLNYSIAAVTNATTYTWTVPTGWTINSGQGTVSINVTSGSTGQNGNITVTAGNGCGTSANPTQVLAITPTNGTNNTGFTTSTTKTSDGISVSSGTKTGYLKFNLAGLTGASSVTGVTLSLVNNGSTSSGSTNYVVPLGSNDPVSATAATLYNTTNTNAGTNYYNGSSWTNTGTITLDLNSGTVSGNTDIFNGISSPGYLALGLNRGGTNTYNFFGYSGGASAPVLSVTYSTGPRSLAVTVNPGTPAVPGSISGTTAVCPGITGLTYSIATVANATTYNWVVPSGWTITAGAGTNSITVTSGAFGQNGNITVSAGNGCGTSANSSLAVTVNAGTPAIPGTISGTINQCPALSSQSYSISAVTNATTYNWSVPTGWTITSGQGTTSINVTTGATGQNGSVSVTAGNSCGTSVAKTLAVTVIAGTPATPGTISGTAAVCPGVNTLTYSIAAVTNATTYTWSVPSGWSIISGQGTISITVGSGAAGQNGNISVSAGNSCGTSGLKTLAVTVNPGTPAVPGSISGSATVCPGISSLTYSISAVANATTYTWTVPTGWVINSGQGTANISVTSGASGQNGSVTVTAGNSCGTSGVTSVAVSVGAATPATPGAISGSSNLCPILPGNIYSIGAVANATTYTWTVPTGWTITAGQGTTSITVTTGGVGQNGNITVTAGNTCGTSAAYSIAVTVSTTITFTGASQQAVVCEGDGAAILLTGLNANSINNTINYSINGVAQTPVIGVNADVSGNASFVTVALTAANNGQTLQVTGIANGTCTLPTAQNISLGVRATGTWLGLTDDWEDASNWCGGVPTTTGNIFIPGGLSEYPTLNSGIGKVHDIHIAAGGSLKVDGSILQISGAIYNSGSFDARTGTIEMNGTGGVNQNISGSWFVGRTLHSFRMSNPNGVVVSSVANDTLNILDSLSFGNVNLATLNTGDNLVLRSTAGKTARLADITNGDNNFNNTVSGKITVERFIPALGRRAWRFLTAPVTAGSTTISQAWQEGASCSTSTTVADPAPGYGTHITYNIPAWPGYDQGINGNTSIKFLNNVGWTGIPSSTNGTTSGVDNGYITDEPGYMLFVRGNRSVDLSQGIGAATSNTILRPKGPINYGQMTLPTVKGFNTFKVIGNPYPSTINFHKIATNSSNAGLPDAFYLWDPNLTGSNGVGGWVSYSYDPSKHVYDVSVETSMSVNGDIQSGAAFMVDYPGSSIVIREKDKSTGSNNGQFRVAGQLRTSLFAVNPDGTTSLNDGVVNVFNESYDNQVDVNDVKKFNNFAENFGILRSSKALAIEKRAPIAGADTIFYKMTQMKVKDYKIRLVLDSVQLPAGMTAFMEDQYLSRKTPVQLQDTTWIGFNISSDPASSAFDRFRLVFVPATTVPVTITGLQAWKRNRDIQVEWKVEHEINIVSYEVEKSEDGIHFLPVHASVAVGGNHTYSWLDVNARVGDNFYRVISKDNNGITKSTGIVKVSMNGGVPTVNIYPNPIQDNQVHLAMSDIPKGQYRIKVINAIGQVLLVNELNHPGGSAALVIPVNEGWARGAYHIELVGENYQSTALNFIY